MTRHFQSIANPWISTRLGDIEVLPWGAVRASFPMHSMMISILEFVDIKSSIPPFENVRQRRERFFMKILYSQE